jgi:hypothetical protein
MTKNWLVCEHRCLLKKMKSLLSLTMALDS